jgi:hypothetical protein
MNFFIIFVWTALSAVLGYMIGHTTGKEEGYLDGLADEYAAGQER